MKNACRHIILLALVSYLVSACGWLCPEDVPAKRVFIMYAAAYSNLSESIKRDIEEFTDGELPVKRSGDIVLIYAHHAGAGNNYLEDTESALYRVYKDRKGNTVRDTLKVYPPDVISGDADTFHDVLVTAKELYPSPSYGLLLSSHAKGWLPPGYEEEESLIFMKKAASGTAPKEEFPPTKEICIEFPDESGIELLDFVDAIPMKLDYCIFDACLMGCVEVAYEMRYKCDLMLFSPTEVLTNGLIYTTMGPKLFNVATPDLKAIAEEYFDYYQAQTGYYQSATITLLDCSKLEAVAKACADIISAHREGLESADRKMVQAYFYNELHWFYDLRDMMMKAGASITELGRLQEALDDCLLYTAATEKFFNLKLNDVCGLSMYYPRDDWDSLNAYYKTLAWNKATHLVQ